MKRERYDQSHPRIQQALAELQALISARYPEATYEVAEGPESDEVWLEVRLDLDDETPVLETVRELLLHYNVDEELPVYVMPLRPRQRVLSNLRQKRRKSETSG